MGTVNNPTSPSRTSATSRIWRTLTRLRLGPGTATMLLRALLVLTRQHSSR